MTPYTPFVHLQQFRMSFLESSEHARRREVLREHELQMRERRAQCRRDRVQWVLSALAASRRGYARGLMERTG